MEVQTIYDLIVYVLNLIGIHEVDFLLNLVIYGVMGLAVFGIVGAVLAVHSYAERKIMGDFQVRLGPMVAGPRGIFQPIADGIKLVTKEDIIPRGVDKWLFIAAPIVVMVSTLLILVPIPFGKINIDGNEIFLVFADLKIGILFILAVSAISPLGIIMAGWASNNKYALLSGLRAAAQMMSYEIPIVLAIIGVILVSGTMNLIEIVNAQQELIFGIIPKWNIFLMPIAFIVFFICAVAEIGRVPFDTIEAEGELVAGYNIEYSGMRFAFFFIAEYAHPFIIGALATLIFFGGWHGPTFGIAALGIVWFLIKTSVLVYIMIWFRGTLPRIRIDQMLTLGWKYMIPLALLNIAIVGALKFIAPGVF